MVHDPTSPPSKPPRCASCAGARRPESELCDTCAALARGDPFGRKRQTEVRQRRREEGA